MPQREIDTGTEELLCSVEQQVATITLNRPEKRNALSDHLTPALRAALLEVERDPEVRVVVVTGAGAAFCAGGDVSGMATERKGARSETANSSEQDAIRALQHKQETLTLRLHELAKPTLAALPGPAAGAGLSIALACDLRIASRSAFVVPGFARVGLSGDYGASWFLVQLIGLAKAKEVMFTGGRVTAQECLDLGIVNRVVADEDLRRETAELARSIASGPPMALRYMKENLNRAAVADLRTCLAMEADRMVRCARTEDHQEAVAAFLGKRRPVFRGR